MRQPVSQPLQAERLLVLHNHPDWSHQTPQARSSPDPPWPLELSGSAPATRAVCPRAVWRGLLAEKGWGLNWSPDAAKGRIKMLACWVGIGGVTYVKINCSSA